MLDPCNKYTIPMPRTPSTPTKTARTPTKTANTPNIDLCSFVARQFPPRKFTYFSGVQFTGQKMRWCTKNDKYEVWLPQLQGRLGKLVCSDKLCCMAWVVLHCIQCIVWVGLGCFQLHCYSKSNPEWLLWHFGIKKGDLDWMKLDSSAS